METSLGRWLLPCPDGRLPGVVSVVTITVAPVAGPILLLAVVVTLVGHAERGAIGPAHSYHPTWPGDGALTRVGGRHRLTGLP